MVLDFKDEFKKMSATEQQAVVSKNKYEREMELAEKKLEIQKQVYFNEQTKHENVMKEIEAMKKAKIKEFSR